MADREELGDDFYLFRKSTPAKQLMLEGHGAYTPFDKPKNLKNLGNTALVWLGPHGMTNSGGAFLDDVLGTELNPKAGICRYHSVTRGGPEFDYIVSKFAATPYETLKNAIDNRILAIDIVTPRKRIATTRLRISDLLAALAKRNLQYGYIICNICREVTTLSFDKKNEWGPEDNPRGNTLVSLPGWDNANA